MITQKKNKIFIAFCWKSSIMILGNKKMCYINSYKIFGGSKMDFNLNDLKINTSKEAYRNLNYAELVAHAIKNGEGTLADSGALVVKTGKYTGRSPKDRLL